MDAKIEKILKDFSDALHQYEAEEDLIPDEIDDIWLAVTDQLE
jgi:hypothetical protein